MNKEKERLVKNKINCTWYKWGTYLSDRQWGTVREDYSANGDVWYYTTHDEAQSKAYRWGEEGIGGICDEKQLLCIAFAFWNGKDHILKEKYFGLSNPQGNHGEDVKEYYYFLDNTPTHSYAKMLYKYPQNEFPYHNLIDENGKRTKQQTEYELIDTGIFNDNKYFDIFIEYAKASADDILIKITAFNRAGEDAQLNIIPTIWFRNTWVWGYDNYKPYLYVLSNSDIGVYHKDLGDYHLYCEGKPELLFCDNETNIIKLYHTPVQGRKYFKDAINEYIINKNGDAINPDNEGTKAAANYNLNIKANVSAAIRLRFTHNKNEKPFTDFEDIFKQRINEADEFYNELQTAIKEDEHKKIQRAALAGMLWNKQFYYYDVQQWLDGDPAEPKPPQQRLNGRNNDWFTLNNYDIISVPDKWEFNWYASWDLAFHCIVLSLLDSEFAKAQIKLLTREWYMNPKGQLPAYEWNFSDVNPPVHAWAAWRVYKIDKKRNNGKGDTAFLESVFLKLLLNFTWWVNRKDVTGRNIFQGGFLGLDNIGVFDRSSQLPDGGFLEQADGTGWVAMFSLNMLRISLELSKMNPVYQELATKFFEHFLYIAGAMINIGNEGISLWDDEDEFYYDVLRIPNKTGMKLKVRSIVGLIPLIAVEVMDPDIIKDCPEFAARMEWFLNYRPDLANLVSRWHVPGQGERRLFSLLRGHRMKALLRRMLDESEFLSEYGVRSLSKYYEKNPYQFKSDGKIFTVKYEPAESESNLFGGNSNWRGPIWFPINFLIIESLQKFYHYYSDDFRVEYPTHSGKYLTLCEIANELSKRLLKIFARDENGKIAAYGDNSKFQTDPNFKDYVLFSEYYDGDTGRGLGASHQTGWTGLIAKLLLPKENM